MGRGGRSRTQRKHFKQSRENVWKRPKSDAENDNGKNPSWEPFVHQNAAFEEYYKEQGIVKEEEWDVFMDTLKKPLPAAFRINSSSQFCIDIRSQLENDFMTSLQAEVADKGAIEAIKPLPWYPNNFAWHLNFSRRELRKTETLERFHEFLKLEHEIGNITRQEAVSMVPPLFLDVHPGHFVFDMCAAPGSKTFQLLESVYRSSESGPLPEGLVVANDLDVQRCHLLIHQTKRMCTANLIVTNHEAQQFPGCRIKKYCSNGSEEANGLNLSVNQLLFDRVLCDVPCSGDGTLRKAPDIWRKWNSGNGNGLHSLQVQIAMRGLSLLKVGGKMVYSTCSMNPVENEAVVAEILRKCGGCVELVDVSGELQQLVRRPGLKTWKVRDKGVWLASHKDASRYRRNAVIPSMFPSGSHFSDEIENAHSKLENPSDQNPDDGTQEMGDAIAPATDLSEEVSDLPLERCMRIVPHDQNTGAFFIAVLHKHSSLPVIQESPGNLNQSLNSSNKSCEEIIDQNDDSNVSEINLPVGISEKLSEAVPKADIIDKEEATIQEKDACDASSERVLEVAKAAENGETVHKKAGEKRRLQYQGKWRGVDPVLFFNDEIVINSIKEFYGIKESFPFNGYLITRNPDTNSVKRIYYISQSVKDILELNLQVGQQLKLTSVGLKMFERQSSKEGKSTPCAFRISSEGLPLILPFITKQILYASPEDFKHILQQKSVKFSQFSNPEFGEKASNLLPGCCVMILGKDTIQVDKSTIAIGCWRGRGSLNVMVTEMDCQEILERLSVRFKNDDCSLPEKSKHINNEVNNEVEMKIEVDDIGLET